MSMITSKEWVEHFKNESDGEFTPSETVAWMRGFVLDIQNDAFHAGKLEGIAEAQDIVRCHADVFNVELVKEIEEMDKK